MNKLGFSILTIIIVIFFGTMAWAQETAADAAAVFENADSFLENVDSGDDLELKVAVKQLSDWIVEGNRHLLNQKVPDAVTLAERVLVQVELVKILVELRRQKQALRAIKVANKELQEQKDILAAQYRRLVLQLKGRALTGAYPALERVDGGTP